MARAKNGTVHVARRKRILKRQKGFGVQKRVIIKKLKIPWERAWCMLQEIEKLEKEILGAYGFQEFRLL